MRSILILLLLLIFLNCSHAQVIGQSLDFIASTVLAGERDLIDSPGIYLSTGALIAPSLETGVSINRAGYSSLLWVTFEAVKIKSGLGLKLVSTGLGHLNHLGIPGAGLENMTGLALILSLGKSPREVPWPVLPNRLSGRGLFNFFYQYNNYLCTDLTGQWTASLGVELILGKNRFVISQENDHWLFHTWDDKYRTAGGEISWWTLLPEVTFQSGNIYPLGIMAGFLLWTADTKGLPTVGPGEYYDMSGLYGENCSHGIAYLALQVGGVRLSVGLDSEEIRDSLQNGLHRLMGYGLIPKVDRPDSLYLQLSFNRGDRLF